MRLPTLPMADWTASAPTRRSALASCVTVASGYDSTAGYFTSLFSGGLLKSEKHAQREGFWAAHVLRPRGAQSQGVAPERRLFPIQQTTVRSLSLDRPATCTVRR